MNFVHVIIGSAMAVGSAILNPVNTIVDFFKNLCGELLGTSSEFLGDGSQGFLHDFVKKLQEKKARGIIQEFIKSYEGREDNYTDICKRIFEEITNINEEDIKKFNKLNNEKRQKKEIEQNAKAIAALSFEILFNYDYKGILEDKSNTFKELVSKNDPFVEVFIELIKESVNAYNEYKFQKVGNSDLNVIASVIVSSLKDYIKDLTEDNMKTIFSFFANQNGGQISLQEVSLSRYAPKYILNECPECGYKGDRIFTDERTNTTYCAACGSSYSVLKYCEPELWAEINNKIGNVKSGIGDLNENMQAILNNIGTASVELQKLLVDGLGQVVTKEYLDKCLNKQDENILTMKSCVEDAFKQYLNQVEGICSENNLSTGMILENIKSINNENKKYNEYLSQRLDSLGGQIGSLYEYASKQFTDLGAKSDLLLRYVENLCTKECFEDMSNALGADIKKTVTSLTQNTYGRIEALTTTGLAQIIDSIDSLKEASSQNGAINPDKFEKLIQNENIQLRGQINSLQELIETSKNENRKNFSIIIKMQEETKAILMATVGANFDQEEFKKMYRGKIPSKLLYNDGLGGLISCPYCGAVEDRRLNDDQYCRCSICEQPFLGVNPSPPEEMLEGEENVWELLKNKYGRGEDDPLLATIPKTKEWREKYTAGIDVSRLTLPTSTKGLVFIPEVIGAKLSEEKYDFSELYRAAILIIPNCVRTCAPEFFTQFTRLKAIVFRSDNAFRGKTIKVKNQVNIIGKNYMGQEIQQIIENG